ncbi:MAG: hypothetical protein HC838_08155, partial [Spirulinaceae cyanobacterium RM2_2_10]|nr:hypothetical protein [Spirulinaceae cyanobacterium RM2_2_10]
MQYWQTWRQRLHTLRIAQKIALGYGAAIGFGFVGTLAGMLIADYYQGQGIQQLTDASIQAQLLADFKGEVKRAQLAGALLPSLLDEPDQLRDSEDRLRKSLANTRALQRRLDEFVASDPAWLATDPDQFTEFIDGYVSKLGVYAQRSQAFIPPQLPPDWDNTLVRRQLQALNRSNFRTDFDALALELEELLGKIDTDFVQDSEAHVMDFLVEDRNIMDTGQMWHEVEEQVWDMSIQDYRWMNVIKVPLANAHGAFDRILVVMTDETERI